MTEAEKDQEKEGQDKTSNSLFNMMMSSDIRTRSDDKTVDSETLVSQTQDRLWKALKRRFQYEASLQQGQEFLLNHVSSKIPLVIMYADLVGSTNMSMTLPADKLTTIIRAFTYEMSQVTYSHEGYVLKYVGDAVISFFPASYNKLLACDRAVQCARSMLTVVKNGINPILNQYDYPELNVKIGMDEGENVIVQYGHGKSSQIDILGYCMNIAAKITSLTGPNRISIGEDVYKMLHPSIMAKFNEMKLNADEWKYTDRQTGKLYKVYTIQ
ncbi:MAG: adenylate/guanylate cyclase domain-containing protein [Thaumarchaeota archaeon]|nr:MAG: adenylate/guanylate cyclase domain-containing protein [Nitrososphaerota archaeon]TLY11437.1 MAG: adenylate/guanylate cyclase domain-containing protein [Nitrososphaerota archaeon]